MGLLRVRFSATKEKGMHQTKISTKTEKDGFCTQVNIRTIYYYWIFSLLRLCSVFYREIYAKNG